MWCEETDNENKKQKNEEIEFNKDIAGFKNSESSENLKKYTESEISKDDEEFKNVSHSTQVQSWLFTHNNYFSRFHRLKNQDSLQMIDWMKRLLCHKISSALIKVLSKILQKKEHMRPLA